MTAQQHAWAATGEPLPSAAPSSTPAPDTTATALVTTDHIQRTLLNATDEEKESLFMALNSKYEITDVLPPPNHDDQQVLVMAFGYMLLFMMGTCGNAVVLSKIYDVVKSRRSNFVDNTVIYIVVLCFVDFGVCLSLPMTVIDQILGFWMFGTIVCKIHAVLENFGKVFSALVLTAMAFDRYAGVCHPQRKYLRKTSVAILILVGMIVYAIVTLSPLLSNFTARELVLFEKETAPHKITRMRIEKCTMMNVSSTNFTIFTGILFIFCFVVPLFLVGYFYSQLWWKLRQHARQFKASQIPLMRVSLLTLVMAFFYFMCWAPFWFATVYAVYLEYRGDQGGTVPPIFVYFMYFIHALPFTNSAVNWILYGMLNRQLQRKRADWCCVNSNNCHTEPNTTLMANGHITTQMTTLQTLRNVPSLNGISINKPTSSSYDSQLLSQPSCIHNNSNVPHQCLVTSYAHPANHQKFSGLHIQSSSLLSPRSSIPTAECQSPHHTMSSQPQYYVKRKSLSTAQTQTDILITSSIFKSVDTNAEESRTSVDGANHDIEMYQQCRQSDVLGTAAIFDNWDNAAMDNYSGVNRDIESCQHLPNRANSTCKDPGYVTTNSSLFDSSYSSSHSTSNNGYFEPATVIPPPAHGGRKQRGSRATFEIESLLQSSNDNTMMNNAVAISASVNRGDVEISETISMYDACYRNIKCRQHSLSHREGSNSSNGSILSNGHSGGNDDDMKVMLKSDSDATFL